jgi:hypothetical protein
VRYYGRKLPHWIPDGAVIFVNLAYGSGQTTQPDRPAPRES